MEITGRITADATISKLTDGREVTAFTIVQNDHFKTKSGEKKKVSTFFKCSYWVTSKTAQFLKKGTIVTLYGRIGMDVYSGADGEAKGMLTFHVNAIHFILTSGKAERVTMQTAEVATAQANEDLPF